MAASSDAAAISSELVKATSTVRWSASCTRGDLLPLKAGVPAKVVSEQLGHASLGFTLNVYQWVLPGMQAEAAATFSRLLSADPVEVEGPTPASTAP